MNNGYARSITPALVLMALASACLVSACVDPLSIDTPKNQWLVNLDSVVAADPFIKGSGDSLQAMVGGEHIVFATEVLRPTFHNGVYRNAHYVTIQASRQSLDGSEYEILSMRLDAIRDTGTYRINGEYSAPKQLDSLAAPTYAMQFQRRRRGGFPQSYDAGESGAGGTIRVVRIDEAKGVMVGTFSLNAYADDEGESIQITQGAFRVQLRVK